MHLSKAAYYADFVIYAVVVLALALQAGVQWQWPERLQWLGAFGIGAAVWTLLEYVLHRWVLHRAPLISPLHDAHHRSPLALIGSPTWLTLAIIWGAFFLPLWHSWSFVVASGLTAGVMMGFLWYGILHHVVHHDRPASLARRLRHCKRRHLRHHASRQAVNFGVSTSLWDHLLGTEEAPRRIPDRATG